MYGIANMQSIVNIANGGVVLIPQVNVEVCATTSHPADENPGEHGPVKHHHRSLSLNYPTSSHLVQVNTAIPFDHSTERLPSEHSAQHRFLSPVPVTINIAVTCPPRVLRVVPHKFNYHNHQDVRATR
jgi:hypothetical protein